MDNLVIADELIARIRERDGRFHERAYLFVLAALEYCQQRHKVRRHIAGAELALSCRDFAIRRFGLTARAVLSHWGVETTADFGQIVFVLIDVGLLIRHPNDRIEDFDGVFDFAQAFDGDYPWGGVRAGVGERS
ncbi:MAG: hypothetical protein OEO20_06360 [Gemmatimonadota bacterium]|nr:hypothetical protein [Gemmatimonadota bacterium]MDH3477907.1 hypothetical protein [Gemmatimonadota bacterium]